MQATKHDRGAEDAMETNGVGHAATEVPDRQAPDRPGSPDRDGDQGAADPGFATNGE